MRQLVLTVCLVASSVISGFAEESRPVLDRLLAEVSAAPHDCRNVRWSFQYRDLQVPANWNGNIAGHEDPSQVGGVLLYDLETQRYNLNINSVLKWVGGAAPFIATREKWAFDGELYQAWGTERHGTELPPEQFDRKLLRDGTLSPPWGVLSNDNFRNDAVFTHFWQAGIQALPPFGFQTTARGRPRTVLEILTEWESEDRIKKVVEVKPGKWEVFATQNVNNGSYILVVSLDMHLGGAVTAIEFFSKEGGTLFRRQSADYIEVQPGIWLPQEFRDYRPKDRRVSITICENWEANLTTSDADFRIEMPEGTFIDDNVNRVSYGIGGTPQSEATQVRDYLSRHGLAPIEKESSPTSRRWSIWFYLGIVVPVLVGGFLWRLQRVDKSNRRRNNSAQILLLLLPLGSEVANVSAGEPVWSAGWVMPGVYDMRGSLRIRQCGFNATIAALALCECEFDSEAIARDLRPTAKGISMENMKRTLESKGLRVVARTKVKAQDLLQRLDQRVLAIVAVKSRNSATHYVVMRSDGKGDVLILDPPNGVVNLRKLLDSSSNLPEMTVLFIRRHDNSG